jgi:hypothetical protein
MMSPKECFGEKISNEKLMALLDKMPKRIFEKSDKVSKLELHFKSDQEGSDSLWWLKESGWRKIRWSKVQQTFFITDPILYARYSEVEDFGDAYLIRIEIVSSIFFLGVKTGSRVRRSIVIWPMSDNYVFVGNFDPTGPGWENGKIYGGFENNYKIMELSELFKMLKDPFEFM